MFKAHTAISYEINNIFLQSLRPFTAIFVCRRATSAVPIGALIFNLCLVFSRDYFRSFQATRTGIAYSNLHIKKFEKLIIFQPPHESNLLFPVTFWGYSSAVEHVLLAESSATTAIFFSISELGVAGSSPAAPIISRV